MFLFWGNISNRTEWIISKWSDDMQLTFLVSRAEYFQDLISHRRLVDYRWSYTSKQGWEVERTGEVIMKNCFLSNIRFCFWNSVSNRTKWTTLDWFDIIQFVFLLSRAKCFQDFIHHRLVDHRSKEEKNEKWTNNTSGSGNAVSKVIMSERRLMSSEKRQVLC